MIKVNDNIKRKIRYFLYIYKDIDKKIKEKELDIIDSASVTFNTWIKGKNNFTNTVENQAIVLATSKELNDLKRYKKVLSEVLEYINKDFSYFYKFIELKYFKKLKSNKIKKILKIDVEKQKKLI